MTEKKNIEYIEGKGIAKLTHIPDHQKLDRNKDLKYYNDILYQCGKCGTCRTAYHQEGWPRVCPSGEFGGFEAYYLGGKNLLIWAIMSDRLKWTENLARIFFQCSVCLACTQQCQIPEIHYFAGEWLMAMREEAVNKGFGPMPEQNKYAEHMIKEFNPYMEKHDNRLNWIPSNVSQNPNAKLAYFVGCTASYREQNIAISTAELLNLLKIDFQILIDEHCCGSPAYMTGLSERAEEMARANVELFHKKGIEKILTSCAGCYRTLKETYPNKFGFSHGIEILHLPEFLNQKFANQEIDLNKKLNLKVTYHDPCHIGRHMGIYDPPREVITQIPGVELIEMDRIRQNAWCCGSGGGVRSAFKDLSSFAAHERIKEAKETGADALVSSCPFCLNQFKTNTNGEIETVDLSELIRKAL